jgi:uncharacterized protein (TIGR02147 family)
MPKCNCINIYSYLSHRDYLRDYFAHRKRTYKRFSYRHFAQVGGYNSPGLLIDIIKGKTNMGPDTIARISRAIGHNRKEFAYFKDMVLFNQAVTAEEKNRHFERMLGAFREKGRIVGSAEYKYFSRWYYPAVRELLAVINFKGDYKDITGRIRPTILLAQAKNAVHVLSKLGLIRKDGKGCYRATDKHLTSGSEVRTLALTNFQRATMDLAKQAIDRFPKEKRDISTLTFSIAQGDLQKMKDEIAACRARLAKIIKKSRNCDTVGQLNFQLFPLTK